MTKDAFKRSAVAAALALLWASPGLAQTPSSPAPGAGIAQPKFPTTRVLAPTKATWESTRTLVLGIAESVPEERGGQQVQRWAPILGAIQDNMNHYGNLVVYLRLNAIAPPRSASRN